MLLIPLLMAATWKQPKISVQARQFWDSQAGYYALVFAYLCPSDFGDVGEDCRRTVVTGPTVIFVSFICFSLRTLIIQYQLLKTQGAYRHEATHDGLTSIWNRMTVLDILQRELLRAEREGSSVGIIMADIDHFKLVNDSMGHVSGDVVLRSVASEIALALRPSL
jgi:hypothetical protein